MSNTKNIQRRQKIKYKIRKKVQGTPERPRLVVYRSLKHIYAQFVDDVNNKTIISLSTKSKDIEEKVKELKSKIEVAKMIGKIVAERAKDKKIEKIVFDRNGYLYHGRVKALADGAREGGLIF